MAIILIIHLRRMFTVKVFLLLLALTVPAYAESEMILFKLKSDENGILTYLVNGSERPLLVNRRFADARKSDAYADMFFEILDENNKFFHFFPRVRISKPSGDEIVSVKPSDFVGRLFSCRYMADSYKLPLGLYKVKGFHINPYGNKVISAKTGRYITPNSAPLVQLESNEINLVIKESCLQDDEISELKYE
ncbi:hypothetical protein KFE80_03265 [bacterium SCSIO 12696]|nr:hypothetical protein KFE80_03265 [bacterium SCSIO 12696]